MKKYKVLTLCGSTRFKNEFEVAKNILTLKGIISIPLGVYGKTDLGIDMTDELQDEMRKMHIQKINMSDGIFVINKGGYIGENTYNEICHAKNCHKEIYYMYEGDTLKLSLEGDLWKG